MKSEGEYTVPMLSVDTCGLRTGTESMFCSPGVCGIVQVDKHLSRKGSGDLVSKVTSDEYALTPKHALNMWVASSDHLFRLRTSAIFRL